MRIRDRFKCDSSRPGTAMVLAILLCLTAGGVTLSLVRMLMLRENAVAVRHQQQQAELLAEAGLLLARMQPPGDGSTLTRQWTVAVDPGSGLTGRIVVQSEPAGETGNRAVTVTSVLGETPRLMFRSRIQAIIPLLPPGDDL